MSDTPKTPVCNTPTFKDVLDRMMSPNSERYMNELAELNSRYPAEFYYNKDGKRVYSRDLPFPSEAELWEYDQLSHDDEVWPAERLADFMPRYYAYLAAQRNDSM